jgi:hypothetical protein
VSDIVEALARMAAVLKDAPYAPADYERIARSMSHAMKSADGVFRLVEFASGRPDSRSDQGTDWLRGLTNEQLRIVQGWVEGNAQGNRTEPAECPTGSPETRGRRSAT